MKKMYALTERSTDTVHRVAFRFSNEGLITLHGKRRERHIYNIDLNNISLSRHIPYTEYQIKNTDAFSLIYLSYLYILRLVNTKTIRRLTTVDRNVVTITKDNVFMSDSIIRYKIATLRCVIQQLTPKNTYQIEKEFKECGLTSDDAILYHLLYHNRDLEDFVELMNTIEDIKFTLDVDTISSEIYNNKKALAFFHNTANKYSYSKIKFIASGNRFDIKDLAHDLVLRAVQSYYWVRPFYSINHAINYANRSMHGYTHCLREYWNDDSRRRITNDTGYGHENVIQDFNEELFAGYNNFNVHEEAMVAYLDIKAL